MRYMKGKIHFNKQELDAMSKENPTLFELAERYAEKAHLQTEIISDNEGEDGWIQVNRECVNHSGKLVIREVACPSQVFFVSDASIAADESGDPACATLRCWNIRHDNLGRRPCWFRTWNEFVEDMRGPILPDPECECDE